MKLFKNDAAPFASFMSINTFETFTFSNMFVTHLLHSCHCVLILTWSREAIFHLAHCFLHLVTFLGTETR